MGTPRLLYEGPPCTPTHRFSGQPSGHCRYIGGIRGAMATANGLEGIGNNTIWA